jgi:outer membrane protein OmpA-like peptidoglycan-associated protein
MLFITVLVLAARGQLRVNDAETEKVRLTNENRALKAKVENLFECRGADPLLDDFSMCIQRKFGRGKAVKRNPCAVTVGENLIRFGVGSDEPNDPAAAQAVVQCLCDTTATFSERSPQAFRQVETIHIDGFTDCKGELRDNALLGSRRSLRLYGMLLDEMSRNEQLRVNPQEANLMLTKFAVRSFGETRPVPNSRCAELGSFEDDRRVTISIDMKPEAGRETGAKVEG